MLLVFFCCTHYKLIKENVTHLCSRILIGPSHQVIKRHILSHRHVAELEGKYLKSGWSIWKRHIDDSIKATWTHQSLWDEKKLCEVKAFTSIVSVSETSFSLLRVTQVKF